MKIVGWGEVRLELNIEYHPISIRNNLLDKMDLQIWIDDPRYNEVKWSWERNTSPSSSPSSMWTDLGLKIKKDLEMPGREYWGLFQAQRKGILDTFVESSPQPSLILTD
jgi:hypothetical protein